MSEKSARQDRYEQTLSHARHAAREAGMLLDCEHPASPHVAEVCVALRALAEMSEHLPWVTKRRKVDLLSYPRTVRHYGAKEQR